MKVSWRNSGEEPGMTHQHIFTNGEKRDGKNPREFMLHLIRGTAAAAVALNDKSIWTLDNGFLNVDELIVRAIMGEPREASILITVDYNVQGDWIDNECRICGFVDGNHRQKCSVWVSLDKGWLDMVEAVNGR